MQSGRNTAGQFAAGNSGRPKGSRNKATIAIESLLQGQAEALIQTAIASDTADLRLYIDHMGTTRPKWWSYSSYALTLAPPIGMC